MTDNTDLAMGRALASGAIAAATLEALFDKGILNLDEARGVLDQAMRSLTPIIHSPGGLHAAHVIGSLQRGKFTAPG